MALTLKEEAILKLMARELIAKRKLTDAKKPMNLEIHSATSAAANLVADGYKAALAPLVADVASIELELKNLIK